MEDKRIREIENAIDNYHKTSCFFSSYINNRNQALFDLLRVYDGLAICSLIGVSFQSVLGLKHYEQILFEQVHNLQDALNTAIKWIYAECNDNCRDITFLLSEQRAADTAELLIKYADPYSVIVDGFTCYSRKANTAKVEGNIIVFDSTPDLLTSFLNNVSKQLDDNNSYYNTMASVYTDPVFQTGLAELISTIHLEDDRMCYTIPNNLLDVYHRVGESQWNTTSSVPQEWEFDAFTLNEFKCCWIELYSLCSVHFIAKLNSKMPGIAQNDGAIIQKKADVINWLVERTGMQESVIISVLEALSYDACLKNTDIMYQPLICVNDSFIIAPTLIMSSRPERNLLAVIQKKADSKYSTEVNCLEEKMCNDLASVLPDDATYVIGKKIGKEYPDIDFALYDEQTNSILLSEMKWLIEADSTKEVFARQNDIDHGCKQVEKIMSYAMKNPIMFTKRVFNIDIKEIPDISWCVIARNDVWTSNRNVPVISLETIKYMLKTMSLNTAFHKIRNREFYKPLPPNAVISHKMVHYAGYEIRVPALVIEKEFELWE